MVNPASQASSPGQQPGSPARAAVEVIAITYHDDFLLELGQALGGQAAVQPVESAAQALEFAGRGKPLQMLVVDTRDLPDLKQQIDQIQTRAPQLVTLVFAPAETDQQIAAELKGTKIFAVLPLPVDARKTAAVFGGALVEAKSKQSAVRSGAPGRSAPLTVEQVPVDGHQPIRPEPRDAAGDGMNPRVWIIAGVAIVVLAAAALWYFMRSSRPAKNPAAAAQTAAPAARGTEVPEPAIETSIVTGKVDELLEKARTAMRERRYTEPAGDNALLYYRSAEAADPGNGEALDGLTRVAAVIATRCDEALNAGHLDEAATTVAQLKSANPQDTRLAGLESRLSAARRELARQQEETRRKEREAEAAARDAAAAAERKAREARAAAQAEAERQAQLARDKAEADAKRKAAEQAAKAAQAAKQGNSAAGAASLQNSLKRRRYVAPDYPQDALARHIGGVVTIEFTVDVKGEPREVHVLKADPPNVFDRVAIDAVRRWRYEPLIVDGVPVEVPVRMAIRFAPPAD